MEPEKFLTPKEFNALLKAAKDDRERCILLLLAGAGLRVGEMTQIKAEDTDFSKGYLHIQAVNAKFDKPRTVVLLPSVAEAIQRQLTGRSKGWLFPSYREGHISARQVQNILDGIATRAGLQEVKRQDKAGKNRHRVHPHLLRHSFAVWSLDSGVPVGDLQDQLGHTSLATTGIYLKVSPKHRR
ncbi:MAG: tyrosine-type recombinase/integrase [Methanotrichaceae archaeon]|nr:tyrosine-type recombinase/integrase [Methanotrichaceae archaeon]